MMFRLPLIVTALAFLFSASSALAAPIHIVAFGDSLTSGYLLPRQRSLSGAVAGAAARQGL